MSSYKEILISPSELKRCNIINKKIIMNKSTDILLIGKVVDQFKKPIINAVIVIREINNNDYPPLIKEFGYLITNIYGEYSVLLPLNPKIDYILDVYQPMINEV
ncbi:hypothetical protein [Clostridium weizhouense]|uniref:Uncharacterized protein n=1 Tax=Clostridium weizhouense TaxID=2859781 RepID=A0ABS7ALG0_9CLOT|nr:hypothetical protein [Clostridium weizhouense]MBW6409477.1 hypothetical protein [Clostridium weizhouense]